MNEKRYENIRTNYVSNWLYRFSFLIAAIQMFQLW